MKHKYKLRRGKTSDLPMIYVGELDYIREIEPQNEARWKDALHWHVRQWSQGIERMFVAERGVETLGYCFWEIHGDAAVLASIYVVPEFRGAGIGRHLLAQYIVDARKQGFGNLTLGVRPDNPARSLYEKAGFLYSHDEEGYRHYRYPIVPREPSTA